LGATNRDLTALKHDLGARLVLRLEVPGVDDRRDDIPLLARHLLRRASDGSPEATARFLVRPRGRDLRVKARLIAHLLQIRYPTNVREMEAILWRAMGASPGEAITWRPGAAAAAEITETAEAAEPAESAESAAPAQLSAAQVRASLAEHGGNIVRAAQSLGLTSRYVLYRLMRKHGIEG